MPEERKRILIVDDQLVNITILNNILSPHYEVTIAQDGTSAIELAHIHMPDLIILDVIMPDLNGFEVMSVLKNHELTNKIPVIFITGLDSNEHEEQGFRLGAVDYITKPFHASVVMARIQTHLKIAEYVNKIERLCLIDELTDIPNRRSFEHRANAEWSRALREKEPLSMLMIDIDNFKLLNDAHGHAIGDMVLKYAASIISDTIKRGTDFVARWGGEEFSVLLPNTGTEGAAFVAERLRANVENADIDCGGGLIVKITVSVGVCSSTPSSFDSFENFLVNADKALYDAKDAGKNQVRIFTEDPDSAT